MKDQKKPRVDPLTAASTENWRHHDTRVVLRKREVLQFELDATEDHVRALNTSLAEATAHRRRLAARIAGLTAVVERR